MKTEYEVKVLDSDYAAIKSRLSALGGTMVTPRRLMKRFILDFKDTRLQHANSYIRVRDEGDKITTSYKQTDSRSVDGVKEIELVISDIDAMVEIYSKLGLTIQSYQETYRESWHLNDVEVEFDEWPWLEPYIATEGKDEEAVRGTLLKLGYDWVQAVPGDVIQLYQDVFTVSEEEISRYKEIKFGEVPPWLEERRI